MDVSTNQCAVSYGNGAHPLLRRVRRWSCYFSLQVCFLLFLPSISANKFGVVVTRLIDDETLEKCNIDLIRSDQNDNGELDSNEFVSLVDSLSEGRIHGESFSDIPLRLRMVFHWSACSCIFEADETDNCCIGAAAHVNFDEVQSSLQYIMNEVFCSELAQGIRDVEDMFLTPTPTLPPTPPPTNGQTTSLTSSPSTSSSVSPVAWPTATPTNTPTITPSVAPMTTGSPTRMTAPPTASRTQAPTSRPTASPTATTQTPTGRPTGSPTATTQTPTGRPTASPTATTQAPTGRSTASPNTTPTVSPTKAPTAGQPPATLCIGFQYELMNNRSLSADDIFNEVNNTLKTGLMTATKTIVINILNETYPRTVRNRPYETKETYHDPYSWIWEDLSTMGGGGFRRQLPRVEEAAELADAVALGLDLSSYRKIHEQVVDMRNNARRMHRRLLPLSHESSSHHDRGVRRLVFYTDNYPVTITMIVDRSNCPTNNINGTNALRCATVSSSLCVVLETDDNPVMIRDTLVRGLAAAIEGGEFETMILPDS